jgi:hypothetical protein
MFADPDYNYLLNALNIAEFKGPAYTDHPGTTIQLFGAIVLRVAQIFHNLFHNREHIRVLVISNPEFYLHLLQAIIAVMTALTLFGSALILFHSTKNYWASVIYQLTPLLFVPFFMQYSDRFSPEPFLMIAGLWLGCLLLFQVFSTTPLSENRYSLFAGLIVAFGIVSKITFIPLGLIPLGLMRSKKGILRYGFTVIGAFLIFTLPIGGRYPQFLKWVLELSTHQAVYRSIQGWGDFLNFIKQNQTYFTLFFSTWVLAIGCFLRARSEKANRLLLAVAVGITFQLLMVFKHIEAHYLIAAMPLTGVFTFLMCIKVKKLKSGFVKGLGIGFIFSLVIVPLRMDILYFKYFYENPSTILAEFDKVSELVKKEYSHCAVVTYDSYSPEYALLLGNGNAGARHNNPLSDIYPNRYYYNALTNKYVYWNKDFTNEEMRTKYSCLVYQGKNTGDKLGGLKVNTFKTIYTGKNINLYEEIF